MLKFDSETKAISIIAKDTGGFGIQLTNYSLNEGDVVYFTVNTELENPEPKIQKVITEFQSNGVAIWLTSEDTDIPVGKYYYDVQINTTNGSVDTILGPHKFNVLGGATY